MPEDTRLEDIPEWRRPTYTSPVGIASLTVLSAALAYWFYLNTRSSSNR
jgi:hypothetical protein